MRSETRTLVEVRSGGQCEAVLLYLFDLLNICAPIDAAFRSVQEVHRRCENKATDHHHKTYARYGGDELPEDMLHVCKRCHAAFEAEHPNRRRGR